MVMLLAASVAMAQEDAQDSEPRKYRQGSLRLGTLRVTRFDTSIIARSSDFPLGVYLDLSGDFGLTDSVTVPRAMFGYRFSRRHQLNLDYFDVSRDSEVVLEREIEIGGTIIPIGASATASTDTRIYKGIYTWIFYDNPKIALGASFGLNVVSFDFRLKVDRVHDPEPAVDEAAGVTAPLPVLGLRLAYYPTRKLSLVTASDTLLVEYGSYSGTYLDIYALIDWRFHKHLSIGGGINFLNLDLKVDDEVIGELRHNYRGVMGFIGVHF
jgi:hypothetical protein